MPIWRSNAVVPLNVLSVTREPGSPQLLLTSAASVLMKLLKMPGGSEFGYQEARLLSWPVQAKRPASTRVLTRQRRKPPRCSGPGALPKSVETSLDAADTSVRATLPREGLMPFGGPPRPRETGTSARATKLRATRSMVIRTAENQSPSPFKADRILPCGGLGGFQPPDRRQKTIVCPTGLDRKNGG